ncbi:hypothetical protein V5O48_006314 [Marasmius crinis-equi]|uniref:Lysine-specific metallo-endopeptidase domain-containing protein n=1 Tax=Marasmius crinis-equi TaxID=585013 RepID=A0ABR3FK21_9AGAR
MRLPSAVYSTLVGLCLAAVSASAAPGLSLSVSGLSNFAGVQNFKITTSLVNTGDKSLKLLKDPRTVLSSIPTNRFTISNSAGASPAFIGALAKFSPEYVIKNNIEQAFVILEPGQSLQVEHDLSTAYNFTFSGEGAYDIRANNLFFHVDPVTNEISEIEAVHEAPLTAAFSGPLAYAPPHKKRLVYDSCSDDQKAQLESAASAAISYANEAYNYLLSHNSSTTRYVSWFGTYDAGRHSTILSHFNNIKGYPFSTNSTYTCNCTEAGTFSFVTRGDYGVINLCPAFWPAPITGTDSKGGTLIHESSHFTQIANTYDIVYGQGGCRAFASNDPGMILGNADSHEYFAENNPAEA